MNKQPLYLFLVFFLLAFVAGWGVRIFIWGATWLKWKPFILSLLFHENSVRDFILFVMRRIAPSLSMDAEKNRCLVLFFTLIIIIIPAICLLMALSIFFIFMVWQLKNHHRSGMAGLLYFIYSVSSYPFLVVAQSKENIFIQRGRNKFWRAFSSFILQRLYFSLKLGFVCFLPNPEA